MPRVFVDITTSLMLAGEQPIDISRVEGEIARRLLMFSNLNCIPVVFQNDGVLFALSPEQVALIFSSRPVADSQEIRLREPVSSAPSAEYGAAAAEERKAHFQPRLLPIRLRLLITARLRAATRAFLARMPGAVREDIRAILIHGWRIVSTITYRHPGAVAASAPVAIPALSILPTLRMVVHPRSGDVLWTAGLYRNFVPLRTIGEMRARSGLRVVTTCQDLICVTHPQFNPPSIGAELLIADAVALLDASDLVVAASEWTRRELLALAARVGREPPAVQVLRMGSGPGQLLDPDDEESRKAAIAQAAARPKLEVALPEPPLWDEVAAVVKDRLQMLLAKTDAG